MRRPVALAVLALVVSACGTATPAAAPTTSRATFAVPNGPVSVLPVREALVSTDGRTVIIPGQHGACESNFSAVVMATHADVRIRLTGHEPDGDMVCMPIDLRLTRISLVLQQPLGRRRLIDDSTGKPIPYVTEQSLSAPGFLPSNVTPVLNLPADGWTRVYGLRGDDQHGPIRISQTPWPSAPDLSKMTGTPIEPITVSGHTAFLIDERGPAGITYIWWKVAGVTITVTSEPGAGNRHALPTDVVLRIARGLVMPTR
ncbi:hypothetical protein Back2_02640 [Nocardioides baekrokdamisoli]|uniref:Lipoprotein n=1 Tax=Nocardioides baekrokdamisoli TaxID=1804624 RepID=A0A3G9IB20_9ACTN|nr:hypothetical protein [Nocardioides baekrokdamisoli]BBH15977.1 hypothetical protein Back2_02640 [Nocardioides baekrokdamisoli]